MSDPLWAGILTGQNTVTRFQVNHFPARLDFEAAAFKSGDGFQSIGVEPVFPFEGYDVTEDGWLIRVRVQKSRPDSGEIFFETCHHRRNGQEVSTDDVAENMPPNKASKYVDVFFTREWAYVVGSRTYHKAARAVLRAMGVKTAAYLPWDEPTIATEVLTLTDGMTLQGSNFARYLAGQKPQAATPSPSGLLHMDRWVQIGEEMQVLKDRKSGPLFLDLVTEPEAVTLRMSLRAAGRRVDFNPLFFSYNVRISNPKGSAIKVLGRRLEIFAEIFDALDRAARSFMDHYKKATAENNPLNYLLPDGDEPEAVEAPPRKMWRPPNKWQRIARKRKEQGTEPPPAPEPEGPPPEPPPDVETRPMRAPPPALDDWDEPLG